MKRLGAAFVAVIVLVAVQVVTLQAWELFARPLWLDEIHTLLVATRHGTFQSLRDLAGGADFNPPTLFLLYRLVSVPFGGLSEIGMRIVAVLSVVGSLGVTYAILQTRFGSIAAAAGTIAVWAHPAVVGTAFEARFYGPFLLFAASFILLLSRAREATDGAATLPRIGLAVAAVLLCTIHYFGVLSWFAAVAQIAFIDRRRLLQNPGRYVPALAGPLALAACVPMYFEQRRVLTVPTWIPEPTVADILFLVTYFFATPVLILAALMLAARGVGRWRVSRRSAHEPTLRADPMRGNDQPSMGIPPRVGPLLMLGQAVVPLALAAFSLLVQPATQLRYWIAGALAIGAAVAYVAAHVGRSSALVLAGMGVVMSWLLMKDERDGARRYNHHVRSDLANVTRLRRSGDTVLVRRRHSLYPLIVAQPELANQVMLLGPAESTTEDTAHDARLTRAARRFAVVEWDVARAHRRIYGFPTLVDRAALARQRSFYLLEPSDTLSPSGTEFPGHGIESVAPRLFRVTAIER